ncbi:MAG: cytochrome d ubiquinol oxidase subunit II [Prolixibacteraceae bacterium]|jgi:cytochrome d ubiquinol oxidase subunit II|nr:cytochrome d ubiquinol oxidase subunit II [Prolixibacteraceae bacterium]MDI9563231.1 cytochrome d ubiquinol oxidase subunit II [Bacteroidota bacterium]NLS99313.1 cytochrome d ubiquinol oxidase subunit II [Bacteroidales bacterium]OQB81118.1 MAG: Cytochrome bd-I ubiquinol oxidase subunit 2 [Bacteroidetes bacterium ADurb.Bin123]HNZ68571.1 cytochrome d ubiquinol oxidase subunit II [Prolixibacteraceae bacterium]
MFENLSHLALQQYWWVIISLLGALLVFLLFVQGGQTLIYRLGKDESQRSLLVNVLGRKWGFTFTTLVTFGGAFFASFPLFYSTSFGGAYWVWMLILFAFVIQAVSYEFRSKPGNLLGKRCYETFLFVNGLVGTLLLGVAVSTFFTGSQFSVNENNFSQWETPYHGLEAALNIQNLALGLAVFFLSRTLAVLFFFQNVNHPEVIGRAKKQLFYNAVPFLVFFLIFLAFLLLKKGFAVNPDTGLVSMEPFKYLHNLLEMPLVAVLFLLGVILVLLGIIRAGFCFEKCSDKGIWLSGTGTVLTVFSLFLLAGFNNTAYYPSTFDLQDSLTIRNSSSSHYTLTTMSYVSLLVPFVLAYIFYAWRALTRKKIDREELEQEGNNY